MRRPNAYSCLSSSSLIIRKLAFGRRFCGHLIQEQRALVPLLDRSNLDSYVSSVIECITSCVSISWCRAFHGAVLKSVNYSHGFVGDHLVSCYMRLEYDEDAEKLFDEMPDRDLVSWNSLISRYSERRWLSKCLKALCRMRSQVGLRPDGVTFMSMISACIHGRGLHEGHCLHGLVMKSGVLADVKVVNALINFYGKARDLDSACKLFKVMIKKNLVSWNTMIAIHLQNGFAEEGFAYFNISRRVGIKSDQATVLAVLSVCEALGLWRLAQGIHGFIVFCGFDTNKRIGTALLHVYAKLGRLEGSQTIFRVMASPDSVAWTAMLSAYATHGRGRDAIKHFELMVENGGRPDHVTFTHLLNACSHSGLVEEGKQFFTTMSEVYGVEPRLDHYSCMVDLMGRSGFLQDAYELIKCMPMEPNSGVWGALLGACRVYGDTELGKEAAERLFELEPSDARNYIMLSNIYSASGMWKDSSRVRALMKQKGLRSDSGCSFIEHGNMIHRFVVGDWSHPVSKQIHEKLQETMKKIKDAGFKPRTEFVLHDVDDEMKEDMINQHSEKLAMAFGLLVISPAMPIIITKNLRICGDCHNTAKAISLAESRTIVIRDSKRFHHFTDGSCSCKDYW
ncbi:PREDICTED: pentatricopeptide repeat-containing protein At5g40410, mitochondrial [Tarenaya hassleriana]|uniref:pentatricopeptide repeat-containing protein At5g40410, mitochondrial n=1 Tax=Tarenaya hassleriana TaxID=28532 RepID=UPI00053C4E1B|nr:PREDICTED: pentatricopeptide repeat-containing protein At5g40410, mitochondrial [Tarenaya hassleriana]